MHEVVREDLLTDRETHRDTLRSSGRDPYPTWHGRTHPAAAVHEQFTALAAGLPVTVAGRVRACREHGGIRFLDLEDATGVIQLLCQKDKLGAESFRLLDAVDLGDVIAATGTLKKTTAGEESLDLASWTVLAKALQPLPDARAGLKDDETRARHREMDLLANRSARDTFHVRTRLIDALRAALREEDFVEVETPILQPLAGGAAARPFETHHRALDLTLSLRISPELFLKRLIIGGYEKVFEIGRVFRNEGVDRQHNPEFTVCECYHAYATVEDLLPFLEQLLAKVLTLVSGSPRLNYGNTVLDFTPPWPRVPVVETVGEATGLNLLTERDPPVYLAAFGRLGLPAPSDTSLPGLMDALITAAVRKNTRGPAFLLGAPSELEPLAKRSPDDPRLVQRAQLVAAGMELVKAYTEENDPGEQARSFQEQAALRGAKDIHPLDAEYLEALKMGLPPTAGWGLGIDRLVMLATNRQSIRDVLFFPLLRPHA